MGQETEKGRRFAFWEAEGHLPCKVECSVLYFFPLLKQHLLFCPAFSYFLFTSLPKQSLFFVAVIPLPWTAAHLNNPREPAAKATLRMSWQGMLSEACSQDTLPGTRHLVLTRCPCALAHLGPQPPTWMVAFGLQQNRAAVKKPFGCLTLSTDWIHPGIITHRRLFIFFMSFTGSTAEAVNTAFYPS